MTSEELAKKSADEILKTLGRDEETLKAMLCNKQRGGWRWTDEELKKELILVGVVRVLKGPECQSDNPKLLSVEVLKRVIARKTNELFELRQELSRRTGDVPAGKRDYDFEKYVTK